MRRRDRRGRIQPARRRDRRGVVLVVVIFFALLLASTVATFARKALIDHMVVRNRDARARAEALARGGVQLATALLLEDKLESAQLQQPLDHPGELWARVGQQPIFPDPDSELRLEIRDAGSRLNLNAAIVLDEGGVVDEQSRLLLMHLFDKVIREIPDARSQLLYDPIQLAANLIDYVDPDFESLLGGPEDLAYQERIPPSRPANRPLLSVDELRRVEGFDGVLVERLRPYVTVYPYVGGGGINPNTAPPHVLALLFFNDGSEVRLADEATVRELLRVRMDGRAVCAEQSSDLCSPISEILTNPAFPEPSFESDVFIVTARARVGDIERAIEAVIDRSTASQPLLLSWRVL